MCLWYNCQLLLVTGLLPEPPMLATMKSRLLQTLTTLSSTIQKNGNYPSRFFDFRKSLTVALLILCLTLYVIFYMNWLRHLLNSTMHATWWKKTARRVFQQLFMLLFCNHCVCDYIRLHYCAIVINQSISTSVRCRYNNILSSTFYV